MHTSASTPSLPEADLAPAPTNVRAGKASFALMYLLFAILGLAGSMIGALVPALRVIYALDFAQAMAAQWVVLIVSGALSLPVLRFMRKAGAFQTICWALVTMALGCAALGLMVRLPYYALVLGAVMVIAVGTTALQVSGNPLTAALDTPERSHFHLTLAQGFNALGVFAGVHFGAAVMLGRANVVGGVGLAYGGVAVLVMAALGLFAAGRHRFPPLAAADSPTALREALASRWAWAGAMGIALYVGAEGAIGSILINFLHQPQVLNLGLAAAGGYLANIYWGGALAGRFAGSWLLTRTPAPRLLLIAAVAAAGLCGVVVVTSGPLAGYAALGIGLFNSIMFPIIFSLTLQRAEAPQSAVSGMLCTAIAGGALISIIMGELADHLGIGLAFLAPMAAYAAIAAFARAARSCISQSGGKT